MTSLVTRNLVSRLALLRPTVVPLLNHSLVANAWVGSYRIRNANDYLDSFPKPRRWPRYNEIIQPPQTNPTEDKRPATYYHYRDNVKHSPKKMWYVAKFIRGMNVDEAIKQCEYMPFKSGQIAASVLKEAQEIALKEHNFEFKSNMWIEDVRCVKGLVIKGLRKHARMRFGEIRYFYCHLCVKLTEGEPPVHFYEPQKDGNDLLKDYFDELRSRKIKQGL